MIDANSVYVFMDDVGNTHIHLQDEDGELLGCAQLDPDATIELHRRILSLMKDHSLKVTPAQGHA